MSGLIALVNLCFGFYLLLIFARIFLTWGVLDPYHPLSRWVYRLTEPLLAPIRNRLPPAGMYDWSPTVLVILMIIARQIVITVLSHL